MIVPVILCGGAGTRLWPASRAATPKQLLRLTGARSLLQETLLRLEALADDVAAPIVVCNVQHHIQVGEQLDEIGAAGTIVLEPVGRNTAPAAAVAALLAAETRAEDASVLILPADHVIRDADAFVAAVRAAMPAVGTGSLLTFGVVPDHPNTGYGYIQARPDTDRPVPVTAFVEKPDAATAERYVAGGEHFWNSGMFFFPVRELLAELERHAPDILDACRRAVADRGSDDGFVRLAREAFAACPSDSIDYALMEKTDRAMMVPLDAGWSDVGSWSALHEAASRDERGNAVLGDALVEDCRDTYVHAGSRLVAAVGLEGFVVVETPDAVLVLPKERAQDVKKIVERLKQDERSEL